MSRTKKNTTIHIKLPKPRNPYANPAHKRHAGGMKDRREQRGGSHDKQDDYLKEAEENGPDDESDDE